MKIDYQIAIPSSNRVKIIQKMTLPYLKRCNIDLSKIDIHVRQEDYQQYKDNLDPQSYGRLISFQAPIGVMHARNQIASYYPEGTHLVCIDDDIESIEERITSKQLGTVEDLESVIEEGFKQSMVTGYRLWGVHYCNNPYFMPVDVRIGLTIIAGGFFGYVVEHKEEEFVTIDDYEDVERSFNFYLKDGGLIRMDKYTTNTDSRKIAGGMQDYRTADGFEESARYLAEKYSQLCNYYVGKDGSPYVKVKDKREVRKRVDI